MKSTPDTHAKKLLPWFATFLAMHLAMRAVVVFDVFDTLNFTETPFWLRGLISDAIMALVLAFFAFCLEQKKHWFARALLIFWAVALASNREYVGEWAANLSVLDIAGLLEPEFVEGSVLTPRLFLTAFALGLIGQATYMFVQRKHVVYALSRRVLHLLVLLPLVIFIVPVTPPQLWVQENLLEENLHQLATALWPGQSNLSPTSVSTARRFMTVMRKQDLQGQLFVTQHTAANVLIINVESLSDNVLKKGWMPNLQKLADTHLYYSQYILPNLTTIRGLYAQFCGDPTFWGHFGRDNMTEHITKANVRCLPDILTEQGYHTVYMQGADLAFQGKIRIIPATGFMEVLGNDELPDGLRYSEWGLDDTSLFSNAAHKITQIEAMNPDLPWMISVMTVGTHHPYNVNPAFMPKYPLRERAFRYADEAIKQFIEWLQTTQRDKKTLIIISGDESREGRRSTTSLGTTIVRNQGLLIVLTPNNETRKIETPFMQTDLRISILDFADMEIPPNVGGRSIFREYKTFRPIAFANYSQQSLMAFWKADELTQCRTDKWRCNVFSLDNKTLFDPSIIFVPKRVPSEDMRALYEENRNYWYPR